jgi:tetratricopeptide (TPR) repeat protein
MSVPRVACIVLGLALAGTGARGRALPEAPAGEATAAEAAASSARAALDAVRADLVELRFEQALATLEVVLARNDLEQTERVKALVLRSTAHVALGALDAAEQDYREILRRQPGFTPDVNLVPRKAMERFQRARVALVGNLVLDVQPPDATLTVDERVVVPPPGGKLPLLAGDHVVSAARAGFDPQQRAVRVEANQDARLDLRLVPNARTVEVLTDQEGVAVTLDGTPAGHTTRSRGGRDEPARLVLEHLPLGEHEIELSLACHRTERIRELLTVDLLNWSPKTLPVVSLVPVRATLVLREGPEGASVHVDGEPAGRLPVGPIEVCPGAREVEVRASGRSLWRRVVVLGDDAEEVLRVTPRPNARWIGKGSGAAPSAAILEPFNVQVDPDAAVPGNPESAAAWGALVLSPDVDLVLAPRDEAAGEPAAWFYSPLLRAVAAFDGDPSLLARPTWRGVTWGLALVDSRRRGPAVVALVVADGPAARAGLRPGDRLVSLGGTQVVGAAQAQRILSVASSSVPLDVEWLGSNGVARRGRIEGVPTLRVPAANRSEVVRESLRAAWATVDAVADPVLAPAATANLALVLAEFGLHAEAADAWRRVDWPERPGLGRGTVRYYLGRELQRSGAKAEAIELLRQAAASGATALDDEGPAIAPAARDRLAELGVAANPVP